MRGVFFFALAVGFALAVDSLRSDKAVFQIVAFKGALNFQGGLEILSIEFPKA